MSGGGPMAVYLYLLGRHSDALRVATGGGELVLLRAHRLPLRALREAARAGGYLAVCPWVEGADGRALVALWTYAQDHERAVSTLPAGLAPQVIVHAPVGATLLWILPAPYPEAPTDGRPDAAAFLAELAEVLGTIPASPADMLPVPSVEADLVILDSHGTADPEALWTWAHGTAEAVREQARRGAAERAAMAARAAEVASASEEAQTETVPGGNGTNISDETAPVAEAVSAGSGAEPEAFGAGGPQVAPDALEDSAIVASEGSDTAAEEAPQITDAHVGTVQEITDRKGPGEAAGHAAVGAETAAMADRVVSAIGLEAARGLLDRSCASDAEAHEETRLAIDGASPDSVGTSSRQDTIPAAGLDEAGDLPTPLLALLVAAARAQRRSSRDALGEAVVAYALAMLGTQEVHHRLGVQLTWKRSDGLYGFTQDREWRKLTEL